MSYKNAAEVIAAGLDGKWFVCPPGPERDLIVATLGEANLDRGRTGLPSLRYHARGDYLVVNSRGNDPEEFPEDKKAREDALLAQARETIARLGG